MDTEQLKDKSQADVAEETRIQRQINKDIEVKLESQRTENLR